MFYNTGIGTYVWIVTNRKEKRRKGRIQLLDARDLWTAGGSEDNKRSLGDKRRHIAADQIEEIVQLYGRFEDGERSKLFDNADFGYTRVTVEQPLRLRYQMTIEDKARFLDACPYLLDDVQAIDKVLGREPKYNWNATWESIAGLLHERQSRWKKVPNRGSSEMSSPRRVRKLSGLGKMAGRTATSLTPGYATSRMCRLRTTSTPTFEREVAAPCPRRLYGPRQGQSRLRDQFQPPLLQVHAAEAAGGD